MHPERELSILLTNFVSAGFAVTDVLAIESLTISLAMLSQEEKYMDILIQDGLLVRSLDLCLKIAVNNMVMKSTVSIHGCCVAICRIALKLQELAPVIRTKISMFLTSLLDSDVEKVLEQALLAIRALSYSNVCMIELLTEALILRVAQIASEFKETRVYDTMDNNSNSEPIITRTACAVLTIMSYQLSAHDYLASPLTLGVLYDLVQGDDIQTRELIAICLCNMSISVDVRERAIDKGLMHRIKGLSCVNNEYIQLLCARCICNMTCSVDRHDLLLQPIPG